MMAIQLILRVLRELRVVFELDFVVLVAQFYQKVRCDILLIRLRGRTRNLFVESSDRVPYTGLSGFGTVHIMRRPKAPSWQSTLPFSKIHLATMKTQFPVTELVEMRLSKPWSQFLPTFEAEFLPTLIAAPGIISVRTGTYARTHTHNYWPTEAHRRPKARGPRWSCRAPFCRFYHSMDESTSTPRLHS